MIKKNIVFICFFICYISSMYCDEYNTDPFLAEIFVGDIIFSKKNKEENNMRNKYNNEIKNRLEEELQKKYGFNEAIEYDDIIWYQTTLSPYEEIYMIVYNPFIFWNYYFTFIFLGNTKEEIYDDIKIYKIQKTEEQKFEL